ncbi:delta 1-pyrroline-5-carboxylate reductase [Ciborinia camelliae]|nr:delta 1-pyrroline-5-carboxylate reductase [Ciborinia camelliae]
MSSTPTSDMTMSSKEKENGGLTLAIIGCGTMGTSILTGIFNAKSKGAATDSNINKFIATVHSMTSMERLRKKFHSRESRVHILVGNDGVLQAMQKADIILLACKPYMIEGVLGISGAREALAGKLVISVAVGTSVGKMGAALGMGEKEKAKEKERGEGREITIVRAMPNLAASFGESNTVVEINPSEPLGTQNKNIVRYIFGCVGSIVEVGPAQYDAASVLAAASLAFLTVAIDGIWMEGLRRELRGFSSPRGTTIEGLVGLEEDRVRYAYCRSVMRATKRSLEM